MKRRGRSQSYHAVDRLVENMGRDSSVGILIIIIIFIYCNWVVTRWQWLCYMYTKHEIGYY